MINLTNKELNSLFTTIESKNKFIKALTDELTQYKTEYLRACELYSYNNDDRTRVYSLLANGGISVLNDLITKLKDKK